MNHHKTFFRWPQTIFSVNYVWLWTAKWTANMHTHTER